MAYANHAAEEAVLRGMLPSGRGSFGPPHSATPEMRTSPRVYVITGRVPGGVRELCLLGGSTCSTVSPLPLGLSPEPAWL